MREVHEWRTLFPITEKYNFQNHAAVAPLSRSAADAMHAYVRSAADTAGLGQGFYEKAEKVRRDTAVLLNADPREITFTKNTTEGLGWVAAGLDWNEGDNVVSTAVEFPANVYPWMGLRARGVELRQVAEQGGRIPLEGLADAIDARTRLVAVSAVQYASGFRMDLVGLSRLCRERGALLCVDAIQVLGMLPVDVQAMGIDFLSADGHKWLCGPEGCGLFYCRRDLLDRLEPAYAGWLCMVDALDFGNYRFEYLDSARKFDTGSYNLAGVLGMGGSIGMFLEVGLPRIWQRIEALTDRLVVGLEAKGYRIVSSRSKDEKSGIVAFASDRHDPASLQKRLLDEERIVIAVREGRLRASPHFYNTDAEIDQLVEALPGH